MSQSTPRSVLPLASGDFETNKQNLREFLESQSEFSDYNFEGSAISLLLNILSNDNYQKQFYLNQVGNEAFLATAIKRDSIVSRAQDIGYVPRSARSAILTGDLILTAPSQTSSIFTVEAGQQFTSGDFVFHTLVPYIAKRQVNGTYLVSGFRALEGKLMSYQKVIDQNTLSGVEIPNINVDTTSLTVLVAKAGSGNSFREYEFSMDIVDQQKTDRVYYVAEVFGKRHKVYFGDDIISASIGIGDTVKISYLITSGESGNFLQGFQLASSIPDVTAATIVNSTRTSGGAPEESIESIRFSAPRRRESQKRAVTPADFEEILENLYANISDIKAVGGEKLVPPQFGKVAIYIKPLTGAFLDETQKLEVIDIIRPYSVLLSTPLILDPDYTYINVSSIVDVDKRLTAQTEAEIETDIVTAMDAYEEEISFFDSQFRASNFITFIDTFADYVISSDTNFKLEKRIFPSIGRTVDYNFSFNSAIESCALVSSQFTYQDTPNCFIADVDGVLKVYQAVLGGEPLLIDADRGRVDIATGTVSITSLPITAVFEGDGFFDESVGDYFIKFIADSKAITVGNESASILKFADRDITVVKKFG